ncbi:MAG: putative Ig domain-containing protein [Magnetococcus sp. YQC-5]
MSNRKNLPGFVNIFNILHQIISTWTLGLLSLCLMGLTPMQASAMSTDLYRADDLMAIEGAATIGTASYQADSVLGTQIDAEMSSVAYLVQGGLIGDLEPASTTTTTSIPTTTISTTTIPATTTTVPTATTSIAGKHPPTITGTPPTTATPGIAYSFTPVASDADGDPLSFSITNMPPWASFNTTTGAITGTPPAKDAVYGTIILSVTDGANTVALPAFDISVANSTHPTVTIIYPKDGSAFNVANSLTAISGTISDPSGMLKVELQITDGTLFLVGKSGGSQGLVINNTSWVLAETADDWKNWYFVTSGTIWQSGQKYTITVRATDKAGRSVSSSSQFTYTDNIVVSGTIVDGSGKPLPNVLVIFSDGTDTYKRSTDTSGNYTWEVPTTGWSGTITPDKPGYTFVPPNLAATKLKANQLNSNFTATALELEQDASAIIVAGGDIKDHLWPATKSVANLAYTALIKKGLSKEKIRYLSIEKGGDSDTLSSSNALKEAITIWAADRVTNKKPLILYMVDHGNEEKFYMTKPTNSDPDIVTAKMLQGWLDTLQTKTDAKVIVIIDACYSGSFLKAMIPPSGKKRIVITSAGLNEKSYFSHDGALSFSGYFWNNIKQSKSLLESFNASTDAIQKSSTPENPQHARMDADSDGEYITSKDLALVKETFLGDPRIMAGISPEITKTMDNTYMDEGGTPPTLWVKVNQEPKDILRVWGVITPPGANSEGENPVILDLPALLLKYNATNARYETPFDGTWSHGKYIITFFAQANDSDGWVSVPKSVTIQVGKDSLEADDTPTQAKIIVVNNETPQYHNTHAANDADWVKFYAVQGQKYQVTAKQLEKLANVVLERYDSDGSTRIGSAAKAEIPGQDVILAFTAEKSGITLIKAKQYETNNFGAETGYYLKVTFPDAPIVIPLMALLTNADKTLVANAVIKTGGNETAMTDANGQFILMADSKNSTVDLFDSTGQSIQAGVTVKLSGKTLALISVTPVTSTSPVLDVDKSGTVDATDGVLLLRKLNGASTIDTGVVLPIGQSNATVISAINAVGSKLDVDQSGSVDATDGVLILRKLNGASTIDTGVMLPSGQTNSTVSTAIDAIRK